MKLEVCDKDMASVDLIGETVIKLSSLCCNGLSDEWYEIKYKGKSAGRIHLKGVFSSSTLVDRMSVGMQDRMQPQMMAQQQMLA